MFAQIIVDVAHSQVDRLFTYRIPQGMPVTEGDRVLVPFGPRRIEGFVMEIGTDALVEESRIRDIERRMDEEPVLLPELIDLALWMQKEYHCLLVDALRLMIPAQMRGDRVRAKMLLAASLAIDPREMDSAMRACSRAPKQQEMLDMLLGYSDPVQISSLPEGSLGVLRALEKKGLVRIAPVQVERRPAGEAIGPEDIIPTHRQDQAIAAIVQAVQEENTKPFLLHGVTGSGKTEVYIHAVKRVLRMGGSAIVLVPEIALTPQMVGWFRARFSDGAAVLHSSLSAGERFDEWQRIRTGQAQVVVGARSAVFAPLANLRLIVVDEEHEHTYQSEKTPQYDAREVAQRRCEIQHAALVLGSATPSLRTYAMTMRGHLNLLELPDRVNGKPMPQVDIVDMRTELMRGNKSMFSSQLISALRQVLEAGEQAMLLINRRGHSSFVSCRACGKPIRCEHCDVTMTYHMRENKLRCHYCDAERDPPTVCPICESPYIRYFGAGTQKVEEEFTKFFPDAKALRMDYDTTRGKDGHRDLLQQFRSGQAQVLIGTQMIAKGHDFPKVTLVGIMAADLSLNVPDYRSEERTFQLLTQMEGRAGRGSLPGRVIVQSYDPEHYAIQMAAGQDYRAFYHMELNRRRKGLFPPYTIMARLLVTGPEEESVRIVAQELGDKLADAIAADSGYAAQTVQTRAMEAPLARIRDEFRWQVFAKLYAKGDYAGVLDRMRELVGVYGDVQVVLEIDPSTML